MENPMIRQQKMMRFVAGQKEEAEDVVAVETAVTLNVNGSEVATVLCTPTDLEELVAGFLAAEGLIRRYADIASLTIDDGKGFVYVKLTNGSRLTEAQAAASKRIIGSCCGKGRQFYFQSDVNTAKTIMNGARLTVSQCTGLMRQLQENSAVFQQTGGIHNAALCSGVKPIVSRSDIGRHNALDKVYGYCLINGIATGDKVIAFSGRISSEVLLKVSKLGAAIILSKAAPTTLGIALAEELGITVVGFVRGDRFNVYSRPDRIMK
ncbi:FdhD protein [Evansella caseinilytica]|uniref:Sulfur carrier protein FdhD n=1 Tax=Evansella caseinilytica TaxID=1503961 RepID=A0A1H3RAY1_9BACI|nr:formate dehydrogenase accessory sulfurtransferase FdhD [Evansella caseinilytica]SDZ22914.1 FdhD protein [Evansella caseinilytica]